MSPRRPSVIIFSATGRTALAFASVVLIRPCSISAPARFEYSALRCAASRPSFLPARWCLMSSAVVSPQIETLGGQRLLHFLDGLAPEIRDRGQLGVRLGHELADRLDSDALEAVVRADAQFELLDGEVLHRVGDRSLARLGDRRLLAEALDLLDVREDRELADEDLGRLGDGILRIDRAVGRDVEAELVVVGALADTGC